MESTGRLLEADLEPAGRAVRPAAGQRPPRQGRARAQDRRARLRVAGRSAAARAAHGQLRPRPAAARAARADPLPDEPGAGADGGGQPPAEDPGRRQHQAGLGGHRYPGQIGTGDAGRAGRGGDRWRRTGAVRAGSTCARSCRSWSGRWSGASGRTSASWWPSNWPTSTSSTRRSRGSAPRSPSACARDEDAIARLDTIPGVGRSVAEVLVAEIGADLDALPDGQAPGLVGWALSGQPRERREAPQRQDPQGKPLAAGLPGPGRARRGPDQGHLPGGAVPATGGPPRPGEGGCRRRPLHPDHRLPPAARREPSTATWEATTSTSEIARRWNVASCTGWKVWATPCP